MINNKFIKCVAVGVIAVSISVLAAACSKKTPEPVLKTKILLDTSCKITIYDNMSGSVIDKAFKE